LLSQATARASIVFPVPGGQTSNVHRGIFAQRSLNFFGFLRKSTISWSSSFSSAAHSTSLNKIFSLFGSKSFARDFQKLIALLAIHHIREIRKIPITRNNTTIMIVGRIFAQNF